jgi:DNA polymerase III gamma/tau subunit
LSRCFVIPFKDIDSEIIALRLKEISTREGIIASESCLRKIAEKSEGAMRNAVSFLDQMWKVCGNEIKEDKLLSLGICDDSVYVGFLKAAVIDHDQREFLILYKKWTSLLGIENFLKGLERFLREYILSRIGVPGYKKEMVLELTKDQVISCINKVWRAIDSAHRDLSRIEVILVTEFFTLGDPVSPSISSSRCPHVGDLSTFA